MITVIDYGMGNTGSILNMYARAGVDAKLSGDPGVVANAERLVLPGVGAFDDGIASLAARGLVDAIREAVVQRGAPLLGICLGMQLLADCSEEGALPGLGFIPGRVTRFRFDDPHRKVPHMGWNIVEPARRHALFDARDANARYYFVHSYHYVCGDDEHALGSSWYGMNFTAAVAHKRTLGVQFHPEKSLRWGMDLLRRFAYDV